MVDLKWNIRHDYFNILTLPIVCCINLACLFFEERLLFALQYWVFLSYLIVDTLWLIVKPQSVSSPAAILVHHAACLIGWNIPRFSDGQYDQWMSLGLLVEINTWCLIARRNLSSKSFVLDYLFYATWVGFRVVMYPVLLVLFLGEYLAESEVKGTFVHAGLLLLCLMLFINTMNAKWSVDLVSKLAARRDELGADCAALSTNSSRGL